MSALICLQVYVLAGLRAGRRRCARATCFAARVSFAAIRFTVRFAVGFTVSFAISSAVRCCTAVATVARRTAFGRATARIRHVKPRTLKRNPHRLNEPLDGIARFRVMGERRFGDALFNFKGFVGTEIAINIHRHRFKPPQNFVMAFYG